MSLLRALRSWCAYRQLFAGPAPIDRKLDPETHREFQRRTARNALGLALPHTAILESSLGQESHSQSRRHPRRSEPRGG